MRQIVQKLRAKKWRISPVSLLLIALIAYVWFRPPADVTDLDAPAPGAPYVGFDGRPAYLADFRGKVLLVNVWATWCPYCLQEMPAIRDFHRDYRDRGFEALALSLDENPAEARAYLAARGLHFPAGMLTPQLAGALGGVPVVPMSFVIDRAGRLVKKVEGRVHYGRLEDLVEPLLAP